MRLRLIQNSVTLDDLNGITALTLRYFTEISRFQGPLRKDG